jgi:uncharacterized protein
MKWERGHRSKNVEDALGDAPPRGGGKADAIGGVGALVVLVLAILSQVTGVNLMGSSPSSQPSSTPSGQPPTPQQGPDPDAELFSFINFVVDDVQPALARAFAKSGKPWRDAKLKVFREAVDTGCGVSSSAIGPFYCPPDEKAYIDLSFYKDLRAQLGAPGDFAQAYVIAHEFGHHAQNILGTDDMVRQLTARDRSRENELSVRMELQADCYAGIWAHSTKQRDLLERGDIEESLTAAAAIGDDRLQKMAGRRVNPETFTHGSSAQRVAWFKRGLAMGTLEACDTFAARSLDI